VTRRALPSICGGAEDRIVKPWGSQTENIMVIWIPISAIGDCECDVLRGLY